MRAMKWLGTTVVLLLAGNVTAQSSGNFAASVDTTQCTINKAEGAGGLPIGGLSDTNGGTLLDTTIQTPNSSQTALIITPSLVTGLYTNTLVTESEPTSTQGAAVVVSVTLDGQPVLPATQSTRGIIYDERFQQLSTNVFAHIEECSDDNDANDDGIPEDEECNIDLALSTLSAHAFNFIAPKVGGGNHKLSVSWEFVCYGNDGPDADSNPDPVPCSTAYSPNTAGACAGPGTVTVQQVKTFSQSGGIKVQ